MKMDFNIRTVPFLVKRTTIMALLYTAVCAILFYGNPYVVVGAVLGSVYGIIRFALLSRYYRIMLDPNDRNVFNTISYMGIHILTVVLLVGSASWRIDFFLAAGGGLLLVPTMIVINGIAELLGITKNNFGE